MAASGRFVVSQRGLSVIRALVGLTSTAKRVGSGHQFVKQSQPLCRQLSPEKIDPRQVAARAGEAGDKTMLDRVVAGDEDDGEGRGCSLGGRRRNGDLR